jgi:hypothetical protein
MIPQQGQNITVVFRNGIQIDGEVIFWSDSKSIIKSLTGSSTIVIQKTSDDVLFFRVSSVKSSYQEIKDKSYKQEEDIKTLVELKKELNVLEREEIREKLNTHIPTNSRATQYGLPTNFKIKSIIEHSREEATRTNLDIETELWSLFSKKH